MAALDERARYVPPADAQALSWRVIAALVHLSADADSGPDVEEARAVLLGQRDEEHRANVREMQARIRELNERDG